MVSVMAITFAEQTWRTLKMIRLLTALTFLLVSLTLNSLLLGSKAAMVTLLVHQYQARCILKP